jgi:RHS repeat-associated protein
MKQYYLLIALFTSHLFFGQNFTDTKGELQISNSGTAVYNLPIANPPSIKNVAPIINLTYSSGVRGGIAGQGWSINSISSISRIATRRDIDGFVDGVDFDDNDKLALDGQRLLVKTGEYWASGSTYETEYKSNTKIELKIENGSSTFFIVTSPDGSRTWYGSKGSGTYQNAVSVNAWYIVRYEDVNGNFIEYNYANVLYNNTNQLYVDTIKFSGNATAGIATQDQIKFNYVNAKRVERDFIKGGPVYATQILDNIEVKANNTLFRKYQLIQKVDPDLGYQRVKSIQESNAQGELSNPVEFIYNTTPVTTDRKEKTYTNNLNFSETDLAGDFDGDGRLDFVAGDKAFVSLFKGDSGNSPVILPQSLLFKENSLINLSTSKLVATTVLSNKLNQFQSLVGISGTDSTIKFKIHNLIGNEFIQSYEKEVSYNNLGTNVGCIVGKYSKNDNNYYEGDFNGDGISEILIVGSINEIKNNTIKTFGHETECFGIRSNSGLSYSILDLNPNIETTLNSKGYATAINNNIINNDRLEYYGGVSLVKHILDLNGDGKSDILIINIDKSYQIISFKQLTAAPWIELEIIGSGTLDAFSTTKQILFGDYNGDGKTDIMLPDSEGGEGHVSWHTYYSNPKPAGGEFFTKETQDIVEYRPNTGRDYDTQVHYSNYYAMDINGDGKSDLVRVLRKYFKPKSYWYKPWDWKINDHDTQWQVTAFTNNIGRTAGSGFTATYDSGVFESDSPDIPIPVTSNYKYHGANTDLIIVRGHYNKIEYYQFNKDLDTDNRLQSVTESNGNIKQTIDYKPMASQYGDLGYPSDFYSSSNTATYPNIEIIRNEGAYLVSKLTATINGISKSQDFKYYGYVSNFNYGTVGFKRTSRSSWDFEYSTEDPNISAPYNDKRIWTTYNNDINLRGANTITWTSTNPGTVFDAIPDKLLTTKTNYFDTNSKGSNVTSGSSGQDNLIISSPVTANKTYTANNSITASSVVNDGLTVNYQAPDIILKPGFGVKSGNSGDFKATPIVGTGTSTSAPYNNAGVYNVLLTKQTIKDHLSDVMTETSYTYDGSVDSSNYYGLQTQTVTKKYSGGSLQGTATTTTAYDNNPTGSGNAYYIGRPSNTSTTTSIYTGDSRTSSETYTYTGNELTKTEKKGHNTPYAVVEEMTYDAIGNLLTKTVSAPGAPIAVSARTITDEYDATKRFVIKKTDHQDFVTNFVYNTLGQVTQSTNYLGVKSDFVFDNWGKLTSATTTNASATPLITNTSYVKLSDGGYTTTTTNNTEGQTTVRYDVLGRAIINTTKGFTIGSTISKQVVYDVLGRKLKESEPYFSSPSLWTEYEYDYLQRPTKITTPTNKMQTLVYEGLTSTANDDGKVSSATVDALGNKTQTTDPGGTINFVYYATGQLKESDYQGNKITIEIDGWGNKLSMIDPNAGTYSYTYDGFGQIRTESTPNGTTEYVYDDTGKTTEKTITGPKTKSKTIYAYNAKNLLVSSEFTDNFEGSSSITNSFEYDTYNRLWKTIETTPYATFTKQFDYDTFGRVEKETSIALAAGKSSSKTVKNTYKNGFPWQILDDDTQKVLWQTNTVNERGQLITAALGNDIAITNSYDIYGYTTQLKHDYTGTNSVNVMTLNTLFDTKKGNLTSRSNSLFNWNESFTYDTLDRLLTYNNAQGLQETQTYDIKGKINQNSVGTYNYDVSGKTYQNSSITLASEALSYYQNRTANGTSSTTLNPSSPIGLDIVYNTFKSPVTIEEKGGDEAFIDRLSFTYNDGNDRSAMFYGGAQDDKVLRSKHKYYSADGSMEVKHNISTGAVEFVTYIGGDGYTAPVVLKSDGTNQNYLYLHRDYQGSVVAITNAAGAVVEKRLFDAWGAVLKVQDGAGNTVAGLTVLDRGYTGHEHLQSVGLINMNGRLYDPKLHRFLQPDNFVQQPENTQNYNRYAYVLNSPLKYTDPSGEYGIGLGAAVIIGAAIAAATYTLTAVFADVPFSVGGLAKATFIGAASAAVTFGIGSAAGSLFTNFYSQAAFQAVAHGTFQGTMTAVSGGKFWSGFAAGALSSIAASAWSGGGATSNYHGAGNFANSGAGMIAFGTVAGGVGAQLTGGNFWQGAATGLVVSGLNHAMHKMGDDNGNDEEIMQDDDKGDVLNWFSKRDGPLWDVANDATSTKGVVKIYTHGNSGGIIGPDGVFIKSSADLDNVLMERSPSWRNFRQNGGKLTLVLKACGTGANVNNGFAKQLSSSFKGLNVIGPSKYFQAASFLWYSWDNGVKDNGTWNLFYSGKNIRSFKGN